MREVRAEVQTWEGEMCAAIRVGVQAGQVLAVAQQMVMGIEGLGGLGGVETLRSHQEVLLAVQTPHRLTVFPGENKFKSAFFYRTRWFYS